MLIIPAIDLRDGKCVRLTQGRRAELKVYDGETELLKWEFRRSDKQKVKSLNLNIKDVKKLKIVVTSGDPLGLDLGLHLTLGDARVTK